MNESADMTGYISYAVLNNQNNQQSQINNNQAQQGVYIWDRS